MIMLIVIGLMSVSVMRGALSSDLIAGNARSQNFATQSAQIALRYCERQLTAAAIVPLPAPGGGATNWGVFANWSNVALRREVPAAIMVSADSSIQPTVLPQCMVENTTLEDGATAAVIVTARGFSPDFSADGSGRTVTGSVVWLQSILRVS